MSPFRRAIRRTARRTTRRIVRGTAMVAGAAVTWAMVHNIRLKEADLARIRKELHKDPEDMTVAELKDAMKKLGIKELKVE